MEHDSTRGQVLPFARSAEYLRRLAVRQREQGKPVKALELLRMGLAKAPDDTQAMMEMAETYAEMQCPSLSNRLLFSLLTEEDVAPECFYGAGCNFYAMRLLECARDCLAMYLQKRPNGSFVPEAIDMIESIDTRDEKGSALETRINRRIERVLASLDSDKPRLAARQIRRAVALEKRNGGTHALQAFALLAAQDAKGALEAARYALRCNRDDIRAICAMAAALKVNHADDAARAFLGRAIARIENDEDAQLVCQTACDMGEHTTVRGVLKRMEAETPYSDELLHLIASASFNAGEADEAMRTWRLLRRIDPMDCTAEYRLKLAEENSLQTPVSYSRQMPLRETLARLSRLREWVQEGAESLRARWKENEALEKILRWGLTSAEPGIPQAMMGVIATIDDPRSQTMLKNMLCDATVPDTLKHGALAALCVMDAKGPFYALVQGRLTLVHVARVEPGESDPHMDTLIRFVKRRLGPLTKEEEKSVQALCSLSLKQSGVVGAVVRARAVEISFRRMRGEVVEVSTKPAKRRKMERYVRRIMKGAQHELHQL
ncbi:MAG: hypothetical protein FWF69_02445 [Firmicutes bacterium]|nr:hypothetical protein [Bacillota bacterium]